MSMYLLAQLITWPKMSWLLGSSGMSVPMVLCIVVPVNLAWRRLRFSCKGLAEEGYYFISG